MAITQALAYTWKQEVLLATHNFNSAAGDVFKIALYTSAAALDGGTTVYTTSQEVSGTGYTAGGATLTNNGVALGGPIVNSIAFVDFADVTWSTATITARGAMIYNSSKSNKCVAIFNFGSDYSSSGGNFTIVFPAAAYNTAVIILN